MEWAILDQLLSGDLDDDFALPGTAIHPVVRDLADGRRVELPFRRDHLDLFHPIALRHDQHPLLRFREQDLVGRHPRLARRDLGQIDLHADAAARGHFGRGGGESGSTHVLDGHDVPGSDQLEARFEQQLFGERITHLDLGPALRAYVRQLLRSERRAVNAVAARTRADGKANVAHAMRGGLDEVLLLQHTDAHRVDQRIAGVAGREVHFAAQRWHAHAVAIVADAAHHPREQIAVARVVHRAKAEAVEQRHGTRTHRKDVAEDAAGAGRGPLIWLDGRRMVVRLDLEGDSPTAGQPQHAGVLARALDDLRAGRRQVLENGPRMLVGAVLAPQGGEDAQLRERGGPAEHRYDTRVF